MKTGAKPLHLFTSFRKLTVLLFALARKGNECYVGYLDLKLFSFILESYQVTKSLRSFNDSKKSWGTPRNFWWRGVWLGSLNPDPITDQNMLFSGIVFHTWSLESISVSVNPCSFYDCQTKIVKLYTHFRPKLFKNHTRLLRRTHLSSAPLA